MKWQGNVRKSLSFRTCLFLNLKKWLISNHDGSCLNLQNLLQTQLPIESIVNRYSPDINKKIPI